MENDTELKVMSCKHASSTSAIQQMADIGRQFAIFKALCKTVTNINLPSGFGLKGEIEYYIDSYQASGELMLKLPARKATIDHICSCPEIYGKAIQPKTTKKSFVVNGMMDENTHTYPDIFKMMKTCKLQDYKQEYENLLFAHLPVLYQTMKETGQIPEEVYDRLGFPVDTNYVGDKVEKPDDIRQERRHRAKILSHKLQCLLWKKTEVEAFVKVRQKLNNVLVVNHGLHKRNEEATTKLLTNGASIEDVPIECYGKLLKDELRAYIHVRLYDTAIIPKGKSNALPSNKGKVADAKNGEPNCIRIAYDNRVELIKLACPAVNDDSEVVLAEAIDEDKDDDVEVVDDGGGMVEVDVDGCPPRLIVDCDTIVTPPHPPVDQSQLPSHFLSDTIYIALIRDNIRGTHNTKAEIIDEEMMKNADKLAKVVRSRLSRHIRTKIADPSKYNYPSLLFVRANLNRFVAMLCFHNQARRSRVIDGNTCLLAAYKSINS
jgi:hypothetical protein